MSKARELAELGNVYSDGALSNRNRIINGNFDVWQRGTSFSANGYGVDRWFNGLVGSSMTQSRQSFTLGQTDVPNEPEYFCRSTVTSSAGAGNYAILYQPIEGVRTFAGQTCTVSFWAKADASKDIAIEFFQNFGTGGSPSSVVSGIGVTTVSLTTSWQKFTVTATLPSISGKTLGTNDDDQLIVLFWFDAGSDFNARTNSLGQQSGTFDIAQVQLEVGDTATPFEHRSYGQELALCQRYFVVWRSGGGAVDFPGVGFGYAASATTHIMGIKTPVTLRATPTVSFTGTLTLTSGGTSGGSLSVVNTVYQNGPDGFWINCTNSASGATNGFGSLLYCSNSTANSFSADAEL